MLSGAALKWRTAPLLSIPCNYTPRHRGQRVLVWFLSVWRSKEVKAPMAIFSQQNSSKKLSENGPLTGITSVFFTEWSGTFCLGDETERLSFIA